MSETLPTVEFMVGANFLGSNSGVSRATKKVHTRLNLSLESKDLTVDGNGQNIQGSELPNASYKSTLIGASSDAAHIMSLIQLMDLENDFFLVRFHNKDDYNKLVIYVDLRKPLVSNLRINGRLQRVEYESLSNEEPFGPWMLVERPQRGKGCFSGATRREDFRSGYGGSRFAAFQGDEGEIL
ncbi:hypothetical protein Goari_016582 [Gossypium aridum]|uniref:Uncharacterized protein n=1 Tax=Gossypium aridum TaxID=34290 RepID=A0A7J8WJ46_GOSAI|nr:hypothetical protein [Gossypium aridum]